MNALGRLTAAWRGLEGPQRQVVLAAGLLIASMFLPWYSQDFAASSARGLQTASSSKSAISVFSFVEAAIFLVSVFVVGLMLARGERRAFHLPGGDGPIVTVAGGWAAFLVFYRFVDQPSGGTSKSIAFDYGLHWGIFFGLLAALFLAYAGNHLRTAHVREPGVAGRVAPTSPPPAVPERMGRMPERRRRAPAVPLDDQLTFDDAPPEPEPEPDATAATRVAPADEQPTRRADPFERPAAFDDDVPEFPRRRRPTSGDQ